MQALPLEYRGRDLARRFWEVVAFDGGRTYTLVPTRRANGQPAFGAYAADPQSGLLRANGLLVLKLSGERIGELVRFSPCVLARFGLPRTLPA